MRKFLLASLIGVTASVSNAAPFPDRGTIDESASAVAFSGGPFRSPNPSTDRYYLGSTEPQQITPILCKKAAKNCDRYALSVVFSAPFREVATDEHQVLRFAVVGSEAEAKPKPLLKPTFDIFLFDGNGTQIARSAYDSDAAADEGYFDLPVDQVPNGQYTVIVTAYDAMGASYTAEVKMVGGK